MNDAKKENNKKMDLDKKNPKNQDAIVNEGTNYKTKSNASVKLVAVAGTEEIGMNMMLYIHEDKQGHKFVILVDCGVSFEKVPGANVVMPDLSSLKEQGFKIDAMVLTHGHEDHIGAIPYLYNHIKAPMYATPFTAGLIDYKLKDHKIKDYELDCVKCGESRQIGPFNIKWIATTHSIPDSAMLAIEVDGIRILHTGDWKIDYEPVVGPVIDEQSIREFGDKGVHALVSDSTNIHESETANSEGDVNRSLKKLVAETKEGRFVLTCFASNVARVKSCLEAAAAAGRKVLILGTSLKKIVEVASNLKYINPDIIIDKDDETDYRPEELMIISTGSQAEINSALWKMANKSKLAGAVLEKGDTVVFSARVIDGRQQDVRVIINQLVERGIRVFHPWNSQDSCIHASGHPAKPDIAKLFEWVRPNYVIPVHSEAEHRISHIAFARSKGLKTFNLRNGTIIEIAPDNIVKHGSITHEKVVYDGNRLVARASEIFKQRQEMYENGLIVVTVTLKNKKLSCIITSYGVYDKTVDAADSSNKKVADADNVNKKITYNKQLKYNIERILSAYASVELGHKEHDIKRKVFNTVRSTVWSQIRKNPMIGCNIV